MCINIARHHTIGCTSQHREGWAPYDRLYVTTQGEMGTIHNMAQHRGNVSSGVDMHAPCTVRGFGAHTCVVCSEGYGHMCRVQ